MWTFDGDIPIQESLVHVYAEFDIDTVGIDYEILSNVCSQTLWGIFKDTIYIVYIILCTIRSSHLCSIGIINRAKMFFSH